MYASAPTSEHAARLLLAATATTTELDGLSSSPSCRQAWSGAGDATCRSTHPTGRLVIATLIVGSTTGQSVQLATMRHQGARPALTQVITQSEHEAGPATLPTSGALVIPGKGNDVNDRTSLQLRITSRVSIEDCGYSTPCWVSNRAAYPKGYTKLGYQGSTWLTHRFAYTVFVGDIPAGMQLDHLCRVRACCNPDHLEPVTCRENLVRGETLTAAEVAQTHCKRGHPLEGDNLYLRPDRTGRCCRTCRAAAGAARNERRRVAAARPPISHAA